MIVCVCACVCAGTCSTSLPVTVTVDCACTCISMHSMLCRKLKCACLIVKVPVINKKRRQLKAWTDIISVISKYQCHHNNIILVYKQS